MSVDDPQASFAALFGRPSESPSGAEAIAKNINAYCYLLGQFWAQFNSLEAFLRLYLARKSGMGTDEILDTMNPTVGQMFEENPMTNWDSFSELCKKFNADQNSDEQIDFSRVLELRDAMAHGRVVGDEFGRMKVVKFSRASKNKEVRAEFVRRVSTKEMNEIVSQIHLMSVRIVDQMQRYV